VTSQPAGRCLAIAWVVADPRRGPGRAPRPGQNPALPS